TAPFAPGEFRWRRDRCLADAPLDAERRSAVHHRDPGSTLIERTVRQSQTLTPFGVGAIYDVLGESLVAADISYWGGRGELLRAPRLERELKVSKLKAAPSSGSFWRRSPGVPYVRFPKWLFCSSCRRMVLWRWANERPGEPAVCADCSGRKQLVPMRFVAVCREGHL